MPVQSNKKQKTSAVKKAGGSRKDKDKRAKAVSQGTVGGGAAAFPAELKRLAQQVDAIKAELTKRPVTGRDGGASRRDQDKAIADRLARLDEKVDSLWARLSDLEDRIEGEAGGRTRDADFDEPPDREFYEHG